MTDDQTDHMDADTLMIKLKNGDLDRAADLFDMYNKRLYNFFLKSTYDRDLSLDLTQTVFYRMIRYRDSFDDNRSFKSWIYQIARNVMSDHYSKEKHLSTFVDVYDIADKAKSNDDQGKDYGSLYKAMTLLEQEERAILVMSKFQKMKYKDIAIVLDTTVSNVKIKVHRAMKQLKTYYYKIETL